MILSTLPGADGPPDRAGLDVGTRRRHDGLAVIDHLAFGDRVRDDYRKRSLDITLPSESRLGQGGRVRTRYPTAPELPRQRVEWLYLTLIALATMPAWLPAAARWAIATIR
jgi:hypothetical protein